MLAESVGLGHIVEGRASKTDVPPLTFASILDSIDDLMSYIGSLTRSYDRLAGTDLRQALGLEIASGSTGAADSGGFTQGQIEASVGRMRQFAAQFSQMDETIQLRLRPGAIGGSDLLNAVAAAVGASKQNFDQLLVISDGLQLHSMRRILTATAI